MRKNTTIWLIIFLLVFGFAGHNLLSKYFSTPQKIRKLSNKEGTEIKQKALGIDLITKLKPSKDVPTYIKALNGNVFSLYMYKEPKLNPYCSSQDQSCELERVYGDYTEDGYDCQGNPFYNPMNPATNIKGRFYSQDENNNSVGVIYTNDSTAIYSINGYELFTGGSYEIFLLKDTKGKCHPYKLNFGYLMKGIPPKNKSSLSAVKIDMKDLLISNINFSDYHFGCAGSRVRSVIQKNKVIKLLKKEDSLMDNVNIYTISPQTTYDYSTFKTLDFAGYVTSKDLQNSRYTLLSSNDITITDLIVKQKELVNELTLNKNIVFIEDPIFPDILFIYVSFDNIFYPGC